MGFAGAAAAEGEDHAGTLPDHLPGGGAGGEKGRPHRRRHRLVEILPAHLGERRALHVLDVDEIERDVQTARLGDDPVGEGIHGSLVQGIHDGSFGRSAGRADRFGHCLQRRRGPPGQEHPGTRAGEGSGHHAPDGAGSAVDDRVPVLQQHVLLLSSPVLPSGES
jgi:hypothetical protein